MKLIGGVRRLVPIGMPLLDLGLVRRLDLLDGGPAVHVEHAVRLELDGGRGRDEGDEQDEEGEEEGKAAGGRRERHLAGICQSVGQRGLEGVQQSHFASRFAFLHFI